MTPGTYYIEMDPGMANREGSGLADDVASIDWLVLSHVWDVWDEPNTSRELMSDEANEAVRKGFCKVRDFGTSFELYQRCKAPIRRRGQLTAVRGSGGTGTASRPANGAVDLG